MSVGNATDLSGSVGLDITGFKTGASQLASQVRNIETSFRASAAVMDNWSGTSEGLTARTDSLTQKIDLQKQRLGLLKQAFDAASKAEGNHDKETASLAAQMYSVEKQISKAEAELKTYSGQLDVLTTDSKKAGDAQKTLGKDAESAAASVKKAGSDSKSAVSSLKEGLSKVGSGMATGVKAAGAAIVGVGTAAVTAAAGAYKLAEQASDLVEAQNVVENTFKTSSKAIESWTNTTANSAGIGKTAATQMVGTMGAMLESSGVAEKSAGTMSKGLVQLTGDLSSFYNVGTSDMWEKVRAGISGETKPLKDLGINMDVANLSAYALSQGIKTSYDKMTQAQQTTLRYNYLLSVTKNAQGDFAKTVGTSMANQVRVLQMNLQSLAQGIGATLLPMVNNAVKSLNGIATSLNSAISSGKGFAQIGDAVGVAVKSLLGKVTAALPGILTAVTSIVKQLLAVVISTIPTLLPQLISGINQIVKAVLQVLASSGPQLLQTVINGLTELVAGLLGQMPLIASVAVKLVQTLVSSLTSNYPVLIAAMVKAVQTLAAGLSNALPQLIPVVVQMVLTIANGIIANLPKLISAAIQIIVALVKGIMAALPQLIEEVPKIITGIITALVAALPMLIKAAPQIIVSIITGLIKALPQLILMTPQIIAAVITGLMQALPTLLTMGPEMVKEIWKGLSSQNWPQIGENLLKGIVSGFEDAWSSIQSAISSVGSRIVNAFKGVFGIHSPSTVMREQIGKNISLGIVNGINDVNFVQAITDTVNANAGNLSTATTKVAQMVSDRITSIKNATNTAVAALNKQYQELGYAEQKAVLGTKGAARLAIEQEYAKKKQALKDEITLRKQQADAEIVQINKVKTNATAAIQAEEDAQKQFVSDVDDLADEIKNALKEKYQEDEQNQEDALNQEESNLENWKTQQEDAINSVYTAQEDAIQAQIDALDAQTAAEDRAATHKTYTDKISDLQNQIAYSHDDYNKAQLQKQLAQEQADYQSELNSEAVDDQKTALQSQLDAVKNEQSAEITNIDNVYNAKKTALDKQLQAVQNTYAQETTDAALEAQAEQLIVSNNQTAIVSLLESYGDQYESTGETLGDKLVSGFSSKISAISTMISNITAQISAAQTAATQALATASTAASAAGQTVNNSSKTVSVTNNVTVAQKTTVAEALAVTKAVTAQVVFSGV